MLKLVFVAYFVAVVRRFGPWILECLENGPFWDHQMGEKWVQNVLFEK